MKKAILLVNVGTPDSPKICDVRKFLSQFLNDPHVINFPWLWHKILVNGIIIPFRVAKLSALYQQLWTPCGSPLRIYLERIRAQLQKRLDDRADVWAAMNYGQPNMADILVEMQEKGYQQITVIPLFPHDTISTTGSVADRVKKHIARWPAQPELTIVRQFYDHPLFLDAWAERITAYHPEQYHVVFSFHGLPLSHLPRQCRQEQYPCRCSQRAKNLEPAYCYRAVCYDTAGKIANRLWLTDHQYTIAFQSRLSKHWMQPFMDDVLKKLAVEHKKILVIALSFVADCLETSVELGVRCKEWFLENGGHDYVVVKSLNELPEWIAALEAISVYE